MPRLVAPGEFRVPTTRAPGRRPLTCSERRRALGTKVKRRHQCPTALPMGRLGDGGFRCRSRLGGPAAQRASDSGPRRGPGNERHGDRDARHRQPDDRDRTRPATDRFVRARTRDATRRRVRNSRACDLAAPEVVRGRREADGFARLRRRLVRRPPERDQLIARPEPIARKPHDIALRQNLPAALFGLPSVRIHEVCRPFSAIRSEYVSQPR